MTEDESRQKLYEHTKSARLVELETWAHKNGLLAKFKELGKSKKIGHESFKWRLTISGFKGKGGDSLLEELITMTLKMGFSWLDGPIAYARQEVRADESRGRFATAARR